jgi:N-formylmaleamate deformylase
MESSEQRREQACSVNGINIHVCRMGDTGKPPVLMIHGIYDEWESWEPVVDQFMEEYRLVIVDLRGHGRSDKPDQGYTPTDYAADMAGVIETLELAPVPVIGHSLGAVTTAFLAADYPERVKACVLEDPPGRFDSSTASRIKPMLEIKHRPEAEVYEFFREIGPSLGEARWRDQARRLKNTADGPFVELFDPAQEAPPNVLETMKSVQCPALLMQADPEAGGVLPDELAELALQNLPNGEIQRFPGVGHSIHKDTPAAFADAAMSFLRQHR